MGTRARVSIRGLVIGFALPSGVSALAADGGVGAVVTAEKLDDRVVRARAFEAVLWGMPAVNYDLMLQAMLTTTQARQNEVVYWSRPVDWKNQTLTPNPDAIYLMTFFDTKDVGPVVIEVPPAAGGSFAANIDTLWQMALEDAGPLGADKGKGGKYLILPPGYTGKPPPGYIPLRSDTFAGFALLRSNLASHGDADVAKAVEYGKRLKVYPLSKASRPPPTKFTDAADVLFDSTIPYDLRFFRSLDHIVQREPWIQRDRAMIDQLRSIGIEKGKPFNPDARLQGLLDAGAAEAHAWLDQKLDRGFEPFVAGARWAMPAVPDMVEASSTGYGNPDHYPIDARALTYSIGYVGIKRLGPAQFYLLSGKDKAGQDLDGARTYRLTVPANVPVNQYWSVTVYDRATHALIKNLSRASRSSHNVQKNSDGSVELYFGPKAPPGKEDNWVPTSASGKFELLFRLYGPEKPFFDKVWRLPDVERAD